MSDLKTGTPSRGDRLKRLRALHSKSVERTQGLVKDQMQLQRAICKFIADDPKTVPEMAAEVGKPAHEILWFVAALKKYGIVVEAGMRGDYPLYQQAKEAQE
jgi:hypothetical protein